MKTKLFKALGKGLIKAGAWFIEHPKELLAIVDAIASGKKGK